MHQLDADGLGGGVGDAKLAGDDDGGERERAAHVDGGVVGGHGGGALAREELRDEREADWILRRLRRRKAHTQQQQLLEGRHLGQPEPRLSSAAFLATHLNFCRDSVKQRGGHGFTHVLSMARTIMPFA